MDPPHNKGHLPCHGLYHSYSIHGNATSNQPVPYLCKHQMVFPLQFIVKHAKSSLNRYIAGLFGFFLSQCMTIRSVGLHIQTLYCMRNIQYCVVAVQASALQEIHL